MHRCSSALGTALLLFSVACSALPGGDAEPRTDSLPTVESFTSGLEPFEGFVTVHRSADDEKLFLEVPPASDELLYVVSLRAGLGSNDVGLDRGQLGSRWLVRFRRAGERVLLVAPNLDWRSSSDDPAEHAALAESFAESVLWGFPVVARTGDRALVDATDFLLRDAHGIARKLGDAGQGDFRLEGSRSTVLGEATRAFPDNTELEALLTFVGDRPGREVTSTAADARSPSFRVRHSFVRLPDDPWRPRAFDPRCGYFPLAWRDVSAPIDRPAVHRFVFRHRLERGSDGRVVEPVVYYVDRAAPEPVRTALLEGARYWVPVFEEAGFPGGFRVELLPEDADAHDLRYNVIQWVNRSTRGWSYGDSVSDPRTGEILKGHVTLGALRVRQDVLLFEGLLAPYADGVESDPRVTEAALARIRQLSAHEVGHTLGLAHNFAASTDGRASVMDYPAPLVKVGPGDELDLSDAYREGCGEWDELAIEYGYGQWEDEAAGLADVLARMSARPYLTDADARDPGSAHPLASLWDNGADPLEALETTLEVRRIGLERFSEAVLREGRPLAELEEAFVPLYLHHRYQLGAVAKLLGGRTYEYSVRGGAFESTLVEPVSDERQEQALQALLATLTPEFLSVPEGLAERIPPRPPGSPSHRELFQPSAGSFEQEAAMRASINHTLRLLLDPKRCDRLAAQDYEDCNLGSVLEAVEKLIRGDPREAGVEAVPLLVVEHSLRLASDARASTRVRAAVEAMLQEILNRWRELSASRSNQERWILRRLTHYFEDPRADAHFGGSPSVPPGSPIGCGLGSHGPW